MLKVIQFYFFWISVAQAFTCFLKAVFLIIFYEIARLLNLLIGDVEIALVARRTNGLVKIYNSRNSRWYEVRTIDGNHSMHNGT